MLFSGFFQFIISVGANADSVMTIKFWTMGSLAELPGLTPGPANYSSRNSPLYFFYGIVFLMR